MILGKKLCINCNRETLLVECIKCLKEKKINPVSNIKKKIKKKKLFVDKYSPKDLKHIIGNKNQIILAKNWIKNFKSKKVNTKKGLFLSGTPGIGKTTFAKLLLEKNGYDVIEFNASDIRNQKMVKENFKKIIGKISITSMMGTKKNIGIIMDEVDGMTSGDRGGINELIQYIKVKKNSNFIINPIICISNTDNEKKIKNLKKECEVLNFMKPRKAELLDFVKQICLKEKKVVDEEILFKLIEFSQQDIRKLLGILQLYFQTPNQNTDSFFLSIEKKNINSELFESSKQILTESLSHQNILELFEKHSISINQVIHENILENYDNFKDSDIIKMKNLEKNYEALANGDILDGKLYKEHIYDLTLFLGYNTCVNINYNLDKLNRYKYLRNHNIIYSKILSKFSLSLNNYKLKVSIINNLFKNLHSMNDINLFLEIFINYYLEENIKIKPLIKNLKVDNIEKILKIVRQSKVSPISEKDIYINNITKKKIKEIFYNFNK